MSPFPRLPILMFLAAVGCVSADMFRGIYVCDPRLSTPYCPDGKPAPDVPVQHLKGFQGPVTLDAALEELNRFGSKEVGITLKSGKRLTLKNFQASPKGFSKGPSSFSTRSDTIRFKDISSFYAEGKFNPRTSLFLGVHMAGYGLLFGAAFDGVQYLASRNTNLAPTIGAGIAGGILGGVLGYFIRDRFDVRIQPVVLDTNVVPY